MIDSGHRRQITNAHKTSEPMIIAIRLCTHRTLPHHTKVYSGIYGPLNWLCIFFILFIEIFFSHVMRNTNPLDFDQSSTYTDICLAIIDSMCLCRQFFLSFSRRKRCRSNIIRWESLVCVCGEDGLCRFFELFGYLS
jgi:hypothetical protein